MYLKNLKYLRMFKGLTQMELANILNISQYSYVKLETTKISLNNKNLKKILAFFNVRLDYLVNIDDDLKNIYLS